MIRALLSSWGMPEDIISDFIQQDIDEIALKYLTEEIIQTLIPKIGHRIKFHLKWKEWLKTVSSESNIVQQETKQSITFVRETFEDANTENQENIDKEIIHDLILPIINIDNTTELISNINKNVQPKVLHDLAIINTNRTFDKNTEELTSKKVSEDRETYDLKQILSESTRGKQVLSLYKKTGELTEHLRNCIADCILSVEFAKDINTKINADRLIFIAEHIVKVFPSEDTVIWINRYNKNEKKIVKGKLIYRYYNIRRSMRKAGLINKVKYEPKSFYEKPIQEQELSQDIKNHVEWLRYNVQPWSRVITSWQVTSKLRIHELKNNDKGKQNKKSNIHDYIIQYPALNTLKGYSLLEIDFEDMYPESVLKLYGEWPNLYNFIVTKLQKDSTISEEQLTIEHDTALVLMSLNRLFPVNTTIRRKGVAQWRPSRQEIIEGFILHIKIPGDILPALDARRAKLKRFGLTLQPQVIVVGPTIREINQNFVIVDDILYEVESTLKAVDITFKAFYALHASYPKESERIWLFLQKAIYNIETQWDKQEGTVIVLTKEYRAFKDKKNICDIT